MVTETACPLCAERYDTETDLRIHLEVEHRKSELARFVTAHGDDAGDPIAGQSQPTPTPPS